MRKYIVQRAVEPIIEQSPSEGESHGLVGIGGVDYVVTLKPCSMANDAKLWEDFGEIEVEARVQRKTIIDRATALIPDEDLPQFFRALDAESGVVIPLHIEKPPPRPAPKPRRKVG